MQGNTTTTSKLMLAGVATVYAVIALLVAPDAPLIQPDSPSYLNFGSYRSATYPLFIKLVQPENLAIAQPILFACALVALGLETLACTRSFLVAVAIMVAIAANPELNKYHGMVMTESLFMSVLILFLAMAVRFVRLKDLLSLGLAAAAAGLAATIRPPGFALLPIPILIVWACRRQLKAPALALMAVALLPPTVLVAAERTVSYVAHGGAGSSLAPRHFFAKAAMIDAPRASTGESDPSRQALLTALEDDFAPIRALIAQAPDRGARFLLLIHYETCAEYACTDPLRAQSNSPRLEADMFRAGLQRLASAPLNYVDLAWAHYQALWTLYTQTHPVTGPAFAEFIRRQRPLPFEPLVPPLVASAPISHFAAFGRPAVLAIGWITGAIMLLGTIVAFTGRLHGAAAIAWLSAVAIHASFLLTAALGVGISRYTLAMWPAMVTALAFAVWHVIARRMR